jgi:hypothetical protein
MRVKKYKIAGQTASNTNLAAAAAPSNGVPLTLLAAANPLANVSYITLTSGGDASAVTFTVVGLDRWGNPITESIVGPNISTVTSKYEYSKVTSITPVGTSAQTVSVGVPAGTYSPWILINNFVATDLVQTAQVQGRNVSGTATLTIDTTQENMMQQAGGYTPFIKSGLSLATDGTVTAVVGNFFRIKNGANSGVAEIVVSRPSF